jgi:hypothetical protein
MPTIEKEALVPTINRSLSGLPVLTAALAFAALLALVAGDGVALDALQRAAGNAEKNTLFKSLSDYINNLRDGAIPLVISGATLACIGAAGAFMVGNEKAQKITVGVVACVGLAILSPEIIA